MAVQTDSKLMRPGWERKKKPCRRRVTNMGTLFLLMSWTPTGLCLINCCTFTNGEHIGYYLLLRKVHIFNTLSRPRMMGDLKFINLWLLIYSLNLVTFLRLTCIRKFYYSFTSDKNKLTKCWQMSQFKISSQKIISTITHFLKNVFMWQVNHFILCIGWNYSV